MTEDEMGGWHHRLDGHEFGTPQLFRDSASFHMEVLSSSRVSESSLRSPESGGN